MISDDVIQFTLAVIEPILIYYANLRFLGPRRARSVPRPALRPCGALRIL